MRRIKTLLLATTLLMGGCVVRSSLPESEIVGIEQSDRIVVQDLRPKSESQKQGFSYWVASSAFGTFRLPDDVSSPTGMRLFAHRAWQAFADELAAQPQIQVHHFVAYANMASRLRSTGFAAGMTGPLGVMMTTYQPRTANGITFGPLPGAVFEQTSGDQEYTRALFATQENPDNTPVKFIYINTQMLGKRIASRCVVPDNSESLYEFLAPAFDKCIAEHLALYRDKAGQTAAK